MLQVDEFESAFRSADKARFSYDRPKLTRALILSDLEGDAAVEYGLAVRKLVGDAGEGIDWIERGAGSFTGVEGVLALTREVAPDLVCTYRNMNSDAYRYHYSLGVYLNALTRGTELPVLVTPNPRADHGFDWRSKKSDSVMVVTDHLTGNDDLVNWGVVVTDDGGTLHLTHVEHTEIFDRYIDAISKIPTLDTAEARDKIMHQLLREPRDYIGSCAEALEAASAKLTVEEVVVKGHLVADYRNLVEDHEVDVLVFPALEEDRIAMHGVAYSLAVQLTDIPLLMV